MIKDGGLHQLYLVTNSIVKKSQVGQESVGPGRLQTSMGTMREDKISMYKSISNNALCFAYLCASLCPSIYGNELVKAGKNF